MRPDSSLLDGLDDPSFKQRLKTLPAALFGREFTLQLCCAPLSLIKGVPSHRAHRDKCLRDALGAFQLCPSSFMVIGWSSSFLKGS